MFNLKQDTNELNDIVLSRKRAIFTEEASELYYKYSDEMIAFKTTILEIARSLK
jgi:hypothetical protein